MFKAVTLALVLCSFAVSAQADTCDDLTNIVDTTGDLNKKEIDERTAALENHLKTRGIDGFREARCENAKANAAGLERLIVARERMMAACGDRYVFSCDDECVAENRAKLAVRVEEHCSPDVGEEDEEE